MKFKEIYYFVLILPALFLTGCETSYIEPDPDQLGYDFYPLNHGITREYIINETQYMFNIPDTSVYYLRQEVVDSIVNQEGGYSYIIARSVRYSENEEWIADSIRKKIEKKIKFVRETESNVPIVTLIFPVEDNRQWDCNAFNTEDALFCSLENTYHEYEMDDTTYMETVTVIKHHESDLIYNYKEEFEVYAKNIGLIYREITDLKFSTDAEKIGQQWIEKGIKIHQELIR